MTKITTITASALALALSGAPVFAADRATTPTSAQPTSAVPADVTSPNATAPNATNPAAAAVPATENWTQLNGTAQNVDKQAKVIQLQDSASGQLIQVPVDKHVEIQRDGKQVKLRDVQTGDSIALINKKAASSNKG